MTWRLFVCSDCDNEQGVVVMPMRDGAHREAACPVDFCPACGSHGSLLGMGEVDVTGRNLVMLKLRAEA